MLVTHFRGPPSLRGTSTSFVTPLAASLKLRLMTASWALLPKPKPEARSSKMVPKPKSERLPPGLVEPPKAWWNSPKIWRKSSSGSTLDWTNALFLSCVHGRAAVYSSYVVRPLSPGPPRPEPRLPGKVALEASLLTPGWGAEAVVLSPLGLVTENLVSLRNFLRWYTTVSFLQSQLLVFAFPPGTASPPPDCSRSRPDGTSWPAGSRPSWCPWARRCEPPATPYSNLWRGVRGLGADVGRLPVRRAVEESVQAPPPTSAEVGQSEAEWKLGDTDARDACSAVPPAPWRRRPGVRGGTAWKRPGLMRTSFTLVKRAEKALTSSCKGEELTL